MHRLLFPPVSRSSEIRLSSQWQRSTVLSILFLLTIPSFLTAEEEWKSLFNGKDLTGWRTNILPESFSVENGAIKAHCKDEKRKSHLFYVGDKAEGFVQFKNFELEAMVRAEPGSNSGIFFHTDDTPRDDREHLRNGYEVQINNNEKEKRKTGSLYAIEDFGEALVDESQWFKVGIKVVDKRITVYLNDKLIVDYTEPENPERPKNREGRLLRPDGGAIALQSHDADSVVYFKDIRIRKLD